MNFKITHILIENFRAIEKLETDLWNKTIVSGDNETSKTGFASAITWALFGRDVENNATFEIIPFGKAGKVNPSIKLECMLDNRLVTIQRVYKAKFTIDKQFDTYQTVTLINDVEIGVRKFQQWITDNICDEQVFRILSNPTTFATDCPKEQKETNWMAQRRLLFNITGNDISDAEWAKNSNKWIDLVTPLERYGNCTSYLTYLKKQYATLQKSQDAFSIMIDQQEHNIQDCEYNSIDEIENVIEHTKNSIQKLEQENQQYKSQYHNQSADCKRQEFNAINDEKKSIQEKYQEDLKAFETRKMAIQGDAMSKKQSLKDMMATLATYIEALDKLKNKKVQDTCPTCGSKLDEKKVDAAKAELEKRISNGKQKIADLKNKIQSTKKEIESLENQEKTMVSPVYPARIKQIDDEMNSILDALSAYNDISNQDMLEYDEKIARYNNILEYAQSQIFVLKHNQEYKRQIDAIREEQSETVKQLSETQRMLDLAKEFMSEKCREAENFINSLFPNVRFQLFEKNKSNDEYRECCNLTFNGHKYADLSASTKIIVSLEVVVAFQKYYNVCVPICCDNMESVTGNIETNAQTIMFYVKSEPCPKCGSFRHSRRLQNGQWKCLDCQNEWVKTLEIKEG